MIATAIPRKCANIGHRRQELETLGVRSVDDSLFGELLRKGYDDDFEPGGMCQPTKHPPGSIGKLNILAMRLIAGERLYHDEDEKVLANSQEQKEMATFVQQRYENRSWKNGKKD